MFNIGEINSSNNLLLDYLKNQSPEILATVAQSVSPEAQQIISQNIQNLLGILPPSNFNVSITTLSNKKAAHRAAFLLMIGCLFVLVVKTNT